MASDTQAVVSRTEIQKLLDDLRDSPVDNNDLTDNILQKIYQFLMYATPSTLFITFHWFCNEANGTTIAAATFLLRLLAYGSRQVEEWKNKFNLCLSRCPGCVLGLEKAKVESLNTYLNAFRDDIKRNFMESFEKWEQDYVIQACGTSLSSVSSAVVYRITSNTAILMHKRILALFDAAPSSTFPDWPKDPVAPGLLLFLMHQNHNVRSWALDQVKSSTRPIPENKLLRHHTVALNIVISEALSIANSGSSSSDFPFTTDLATFWPSFCNVIQFIPTDRLTNSVDIRRLITTHLHDTGTVFVPILRSFLNLLKRVGEKLWENEGPDYPQVVFDSLKDNPSFIELILKEGASDQIPWFLSWFAVFLRSVTDIRVHADILAKMADLLFEELQHERFGDVRPVAMLSAAKMLTNRWKTPSARESILHTMDIHVDVLIDEAFSPSKKRGQWQNVRLATRDLIDQTRASDTERIEGALSSLAETLGRAIRNKDQTPLYEVSSLNVRKQFWRKNYDSIRWDDPDAMGRTIKIIAPIAHLDSVLPKSYKINAETPERKKLRTAMDDTCQEINTALAVVQDGFLEAVNRFTDKNGSSSMLEFLQLPDVGKNLIKLMLSPVETFQDGAKALVGAAFDVDLRMDCFRALFENLPDASFDGLFGFLTTFINHAPLVTEACSLSKALVRCLTDIIEVLCNSQSGLLLTPLYRRSSEKNGPASRLLDLWSLMAKAITVIFKRTPLWSSYFDNQDMIVWMRDALIFGRDMLAQRRVIETAASSSQPDMDSMRGKISSTEKKMVGALEDTLLELARWLRLTDEELLHQSFSLLQSLLDCFRESKVPPPHPAMDKLKRHIAEARQKDPKRPQSRLDSTRLIILENALASFEEEDEVEIISHTVAPIAPKKEPAKPRELKQKKLDFRKRKDVSKQPELKTELRRSSPAQAGRHAPKLDTETTFTTFRRPTAIPAKPPVPVGDKLQLESKNEGSSTAPPKDSDSSDSSSDDDESQRAGLASLAQVQRSPKIKKKPTERRQTKMLEIPGVTTAVAERARLREAARRAALRLKPDISGFHRAILSWDYTGAGDIPPQFPFTLRNIPNQFRDYRHYHDIFHPLLLLESWQQLQQSKEEPQDSFECKITGRRWAGQWLELDITFTGAVAKGWYLAETDIVLLSRPGGMRTVLSKVENYRPSQTTLSASLRCCVPPGQDPGLGFDTVWMLSKVLSLSTLHREYAALTSLDYYDYRDIVLRPTLPKPTAIDQPKIEKVMNKYHVNKPQAVAICNALEAEGFVLIQGPPGTGKTTTICSLVSAFLSNRPVAIVPGKLNVDKSTPPPPKVLLCAPSNAAIDEIATRLSEQLRSPDRAHVVRVGALTAMSHSVKEIALDYLVDQILEPNEASVKETQNQISAQKADLDSVKRDIDKTEKELKSATNNPARSKLLEEQLRSLREKRTQLSKQIQRLMQERTSESRTLDAARRKARLDVLRDADVICSTLSGAGHEMMEQLEFEMVIIDEAAQAVELSSLIPLKYSCKRCIMVGDPQQLPPTVLSLEASKYLYNQSLFVRLQRQRPEAVHLLSIQYRMHPDISKLPSNLFYGGQLRDGPDMAQKTARPWHGNPMFGPYKFFNVSKGVEEKSGRSVKNRHECDVAVALYNRLRTEYSSTEFRIGVVSMYRAQVTEIRRAFEQRFGHSIFTLVDFNTVDGFQGQEKDVIILSCVRAGPGLQSVGFLSDVRRMNVALTRAKCSIFVLGHAATLERSDETWKKIVGDARARAALLDTEPSYFTARSHPVASATPRTSPRKSLKLSQPASSASVPDNLVLPREFKDVNKLKRKNTDTIEGAEQTGSTKKKKLASEEHEREMPPPAQQGSSSRQPPVDSAHPRPAKPRKRPQETNIFIPKKKPKR